MTYGKEKNILYVGIPSGSLNEQVIRLLDKSGRPVKKGRLYELTTPFDKEVRFRVLDRKEMPELTHQYWFGMETDYQIEHY